MSSTRRLKPEPGIEFDAEELLALARLDLEKGDPEGALAKLKELLAETKPAAEAIALSARVYAQLRLHIRAKDLFKRYLAIHPDAVDETFQLGMVSFDGGNASEALALWGKVLKKQPTHPPALFYSGLALARDGKTADAKRSLDILLQSAAPDNLYVNQAKGLLEAIDGRAAGTPDLPGHAYQTAGH
jgi:tetratricopeptide (TPR) repeat protein